MGDGGAPADLGPDPSAPVWSQSPRRCRWTGLEVPKRRCRSSTRRRRIKTWCEGVLGQWMKTHRPDEVMVMAAWEGETETPAMASGSGDFHLGS